MLDRNLIEAGSDKSRILMVMIYIPDIDAKKGKERLTSAAQVKWGSGADGLED